MQAPTKKASGTSKQSQDRLHISQWFLLKLIILFLNVQVSKSYWTINRPVSMTQKTKNVVTCTANGYLHSQRLISNSDILMLCKSVHNKPLHKKPREQWQIHQQKP